MLHSRGAGISGMAVMRPWSSRGLELEIDKIVDALVVGSSVHG